MGFILLTQITVGQLHQHFYILKKDKIGFEYKIMIFSFFYFLNRVKPFFDHKSLKLNTKFNILNFKILFGSILGRFAASVNPINSS